MYHAKCMLGNVVGRHKKIRIICHLLRKFHTATIPLNSDVSFTTTATKKFSKVNILPSNELVSHTKKPPKVF